MTAKREMSQRLPQARDEPVAPHLVMCHVVLLGPEGLLHALCLSQVWLHGVCRRLLPIAVVSSHDGANLAERLVVARHWAER